MSKLAAKGNQIKQKSEARDMVNQIRKKAREKRKEKIALESDPEEDECFCLVCVEPFSNSRRGEKWVQCTKCRPWAHEACVPENRFCNWQNCDSLVSVPTLT